MPDQVNPLLNDAELPEFSAIKTEHIEPALDIVLSKNRKRIEQLIKETIDIDWQSFIAPMEEWNDQLEKLWSPISHLHAVMNSDELRNAYNACLPKLTVYATEMGQNEGLYQANKKLFESKSFQSLSEAQQKVIENNLRDFKLSGIALDKVERRRFGEIKTRLAELTTQFSNNVLDATHGWYKHIADVGLLAGVPEAVLDVYKQAAVAKELDGYVITLDVPAYLPLMQYCDNSLLREEVYQAFCTRASDCGPTAGQWDNSPLMDEILVLRHELAQLLGFDNFAQRSLASKMADSSQQVVDFINDLADKSLVVAMQDYAQLLEFSRRQGLEEINAWDVPYYSEKLRLEKYAVSQEELRPYFPVEKVTDGMFVIVKRLFGVDCEEINDIDRWHPDVRTFSVKRDGEEMAKFYLDLFAREHKRGGAWMADCRVRRIDVNNTLQLPVAFLVCNFTPPSDSQPSLLTHNEVTTLFHEFGHGLHHMLTKIDCAAVSGINGVAWDAVELPSQFLENWCWDKEALEIISSHYQTAEPLPGELLEKMLAAKNFQSGMQMMRQLEFALFDFTLHMNYQSDLPVPIQQVLDDVRSKMAVYPVPDYNRFQHGFSHIFAGGYAAGYYSYKWAEVLSADAFSLFEEEGVFNAKTGRSFLENILEQGGSRDPMSLFKAFRGREPEVTALLRHCGIFNSESVS